MHLEASFQKVNRQQFDQGLLELSKKLQMEIKVHYEEPHRLRNIAILVSKEHDCLEKIMEAKNNGEIQCKIPVIIGSENTLNYIARRFEIPFETVVYSDNPQESENKILRLIENYNVDLIVLARYMRILSPNFVWRYPNRIINIHPSLLPAFPGAYAYVQAYERGAKVVGCTAHFVTEDLDQGPIICQESFKVQPSDTLESIKKTGRALEATTLLEALKLYLQGMLEVYWGRVHVLSPNDLP
jgi:formyltetrahydrofolate deformylase